MRADWRPSVRTRVTAGASAVLAVALLLAALTAAGLLRRALASDAESQLLDRVDEVEALASSGLLTPVLEPTGQEVGQVQVVDAAGEVVAVTPGLAGRTRLDVIDPPAVGEQAIATIDGTQIGGDANEHYLLVVRTIATISGPLGVYAVTSLDAAEHAERYLRDSLLIGVPMLVALAAWLTYLVVGRALAPVDAMRAEVDRIEATDLSGRVRAASSDDEVARLGDTLNRMLERLDEAASRQQLYAAAASHELRSPLSAIRTELEVGLAYPERAQWPKVAEDVLIEVARLEQLASDLRVLTRSQALAAEAGSRFDLAGVIAAEVERRRPERGIRYVVRLSPADVTADPDAVLRVVRNLFDNAERHAATEIAVDVGPGPGGVTLTVGNDGDPIPASEQERIFEPFLRLDEARTLDAGGSGLGLAIARSIMLACGGSLSAVHLERGAVFEAQFPPPAPAG